MRCDGANDQKRYTTPGQLLYCYIFRELAHLAYIVIGASHSALFIWIPERKVSANDFHSFPLEPRVPQNSTFKYEFDAYQSS